MKQSPPWRNRSRGANTIRDSGPSPLVVSAAKHCVRLLLKGQGHFHQVVFVFIGTSVGSHQCHFGSTGFDQTCGFPGEGPWEDDTIFHSANIGSIQSNHEWKTWQSHITCLQETRIGKNNHRTASFAIREAGFSPVLSDLLPGFIPHKSKMQTPCGGSAVLGPPALTQPFLAHQDATGLFETLHKTRRVALAWVQVTSSRKALVCSVYAATGASQDNTTHNQNNLLFRDLFSMFAQFGNIPIILAGDLQALPLSYPAISEAVHCHNWNDPLNNLDELGQIDRPFTYSRDSLFSGSGDACSSIDAVLLNQSAFLALKHCEVLPLHGKQHRPIRCVFSWKVLSQVGYMVYKFAPLDVSHLGSNQPGGDSLPPPEDKTDDLTWTEHWSRRFDPLSNPDAKWDVVNDFLISHLKAKGASWGPGPRCRAKPPRFVAKTVCPVQYSDYCAATRRSALLHKLLGRLNELFIRRSRLMVSPQDQFVFDRTADKVARALRVFQFPHDWGHARTLTLVHIQAARAWAQEQITLHTKNVKFARIRHWKDRIKDSAKVGCSFVFRHLRNRLVDEPPNLVEDDEGQILYQPDAVLTHLNSKWDSVYSANTLHEHPLKMLETVWPYIKHHTHEAHIPPIDAKSLRAVIQRRKKHAAPGLDGWRTGELQALSSHAFVPVALFFQWAEQQFGDNLPKMLTCTKQVLLNKPGPSEAMNKRIITILPALLLAYTGARYEQLQEWQQITMPASIIGGIKHRTMPMLHTAMRLDIDQAKAQGQGLVGVKLDKAKCFDRIIPSHASALFLAFGLPKGLVNMFTKIYKGLHRHLCYKGWTNPTSTTASNGFAQGCSLSLIAINVHTKVWVHMLDHLPAITTKAYVDDAYLWCHIQNIAVLDKAIQVTKLWDALNGQRLNDGKSTVWGTNRKARKAIQTLFPQMQLAFVFDALGTKIYASERNDCDFDDARLRKTCATIECIGALPLPMRLRSYLIGTKAIPALTFGACITRIPKVALQKIQAAAVKAIWHGRPPNRSKWLVQVFHGISHRTDPVLAHAFACIMDVARYCRHFPSAVDQLRALWPHKDVLKHSVIAQLHAACHTLHLTLNDKMQIRFRDSQPIQLGVCTPQDLKQPLVHIARQYAYEAAGASNRKDLSPPQGLLDFHATTRFLAKPTFETPKWPTAAHHCESALVGCTLTRDRLSAAGWVPSAECRFCGKAKESLPHLVFDCTEYHKLTSKPVLHDLGANFALLGIVEHPFRLSQFRLQSEDAHIGDAVQFDASLPILQLWTDGSVLWQPNFWTTTLSIGY